MSLLDTLKSLLGLGPSGTRDARTRDVDVTVEHEPGETEPDAEDEHAVKGTDDGPTVEHDATSPSVDHTEETTDADDAEVDDSTADDTEDDAADETAADEADDDEAATADDGAEEDTGADAGTDESTEVLKGIGPSYADRLADAGVETVADLAAADPDALAEDTDISEKRLGRWVDRAKAR
jgi:predicted flap endonuclease-1-like 5' DNA nuclease